MRGDDPRFAGENLAEWANWAPEPPGVEPAKKEESALRRTVSLPDIAKYKPTT